MRSFIVHCTCNWWSECDSSTAQTRQIVIGSIKWASSRELLVMLREQEFNCNPCKIWGITLRKIMIEKYWSFALLIICHFFLLLSTWGPGCHPGWCHQSNQHLCAFRSQFDFSAWKWLPVFWQAFVNMSVEWMRRNRPKILENNNSESGAASPAHCLELISNQSWHLSTSSFWHKQMFFLTITAKSQTAKGPQRVCKKTRRCHSKRFKQFKTIYHSMSSQI